MSEPLSERDLEIVRLRLFGWTYKQIARDFEISGQGVRAILQKSLRRLFRAESKWAAAERRLRELNWNPNPLELSKDDLDLSTRTRNCLHNAEIHTVAQLIRFTRKELLRKRGFGVVTIGELRRVLSGIGIPNALK